MKRKVVNYGHSVRERLLKIAKEKNVQLEYVLLRYAFERFLFRLGRSDYAERFILKGASAFSVWMGPFCRVTRDADVEAFGEASAESIVAAFRSICSVPNPEDAVEFDFDSFAAEEIKKEDKYPGLRVTFSASIGGARVTLQVDVGFGDSVYPKANMTEYPTLIGGAEPRILVYPRYTVVAEKFQVMVAKGLLNSRLKDYYDLWLLAERFEFERDVLADAIKRTFDRRETEIPQEIPEALTAAFWGDSGKQAQWNAFLRKLGAAPKPESLETACRRIAALLEPVLSVG